MFTLLLQHSHDGALCPSKLTHVFAQRCQLLQGTVARSSRLAQWLQIGAHRLHLLAAQVLVMKHHCHVVPELGQQILVYSNGIGRTGGNRRACFRHLVQLTTCRCLLPRLDECCETHRPEAFQQHHIHLVVKSRMQVRHDAPLLFLEKLRERHVANLG